LSAQVLWKALVLFSIQLGSSMKVVGVSWLFKADAVACWPTLSMCLLSYQTLCLLGGLSRTLEALEWNLEVRPFFFLWPGHGCKRLSCNVWAEPDNDEHPALVLLPVVEISGSRWSSLWISVAWSWTGGFSRRRAHLDDEQSYMHPVIKCWGAEGWWCVPNSLMKVNSLTATYLILKHHFYNMPKRSMLLRYHLNTKELFGFIAKCPPCLQTDTARALRL